MADVLQRIADALGGQTATDYQAQTGQEMAPGILDYVKRVLSGDVAASGMPQNRYDPTQSPAQNARNPLALEDAINVALGVGPGAIRAYHGSPYNFEKFDINKIGTGEGHQAYGHGLYFAENPATARNYRETLAGNNVSSLMERLPEYFKPGNIVPGYAGMNRVLEYQPKADYGFSVKVQSVDAAGNPIPGERPRWHETMPSAKQIEQVLGKPPGHTYEVDIHADPQRFLAWDKPLAEQGKIGEIANEMVPAKPWTAVPSASGKTAQILHPGGWATNAYPGNYAQSKAQQIIDSRNATDTGLGRAGQAVAPRTPELAQQFRDAGIPGIRYLDQGSRAANEGSSNFVTFSDDIIEILRKYGLAGATGGAGALAASNPYADGQR